MYFNAIILFFVAIPYWIYVEFYLDVFLISFIGGVISLTGISFLNTALALDGPAGPITAISAMNSPLLVIIMGIWNQKMISAMQIIACISGM